MVLGSWEWGPFHQQPPKNSTSVSDNCAFLCQSDRKIPDVSAISPTPPWGPWINESSGFENMINPKDRKSKECMGETKSRQHKKIKQTKRHSCRQNPYYQQQQVPPTGSQPIVARSLKKRFTKSSKLTKEWLWKLSSSASIVQPGEENLEWLEVLTVWFSMIGLIGDPSFFISFYCPHSTFIHPIHLAKLQPLYTFPPFSPSLPLQCCSGKGCFWFITVCTELAELVDLDECRDIRP